MRNLFRRINRSGRALVLGALLLSIGESCFAVGFEHLVIPDGDDVPIEAAVWYPSSAPTRATQTELFEEDVAEGGAIGPGLVPLVIFSHGTGGSYIGHYDTALALAQAGFIVVALTHTGDNYRDQSRALKIWDRPRQVSRVLDFMLQRWAGREHIDSSHIGMFGFSAGGFTTLALVGGRPDFAKVARHCAEQPNEWSCKYTARLASSTDNASVPVLPALSDSRIKAAVVAAPALGYVFAPDGLAHVTVPIQLWRAEHDQILPSPYFAEPVAAALPLPPEYHVVPGADHFDFLAPCSARLAAVAAAICSDPDGFDRRAFHASFNKAVVAFFQTHLRATPP